jgi:hypothetical protein
MDVRVVEPSDEVAAQAAQSSESLILAQD